MAARWLRPGVLALLLAAAPAVRADDRSAPILRLEGGPNTPITCLAFGPGDRLFAAGYDKVVHVWDWDPQQGQFVASSRAYRIPIVPGTGGVINAVAVSADGRWLAIGAQGVYRSEASYQQGARSVPVGQLPLPYRQDRGLIYVLELDPATCREKGRFVLRKHEAPIRSLKFAPPAAGRPARRVSVSTEPEDSATPEGRVCLWDVEAATRGSRPDREATALADDRFPKVGRTCPAIAIQEGGPDRVQVALAWHEKKVRVWDVVAGRSVRREIPDSPDAASHAVDHVPGLGWVASGVGKSGDAYYGRVQTWTDAPGQPSAPAAAPIALNNPDPGLVDVPVASALVPNGGRQLLVLVRPTPQAGRGQKSSPSDYLFRLVDLDRRSASAPRPGWSGPNLMPILAMSPSGRYVAAADGASPQIRVFALAGLAGGKGPAPQVLAGSGDRVASVRFLRHPDRPTPGLALQGAAPAGAATEYVLDFSRRQLVADPEKARWQPDGPPTEWQQEKAPDGALLPSLRWRQPGGRWQTVPLSLLPEQGTVTAATLVPAWQGSKHLTPFLAVATRDTTGHPELMLCHPETGQRVRRLVGHSRPIASLAATADGRYLASASGERTVCLWSLIDLDDVVARRGAIQGFTCRESAGAVTVAEVDPAGPAGPLLKPGDVLESVAFQEGAPGRKLASLAQLTEALWDLGWEAEYWLGVRRAGAAAVPVKLRTGQGVDTRPPLLSLFVNRLGTESPEWIAWTAAGSYDSRGGAIEGLVGWHFNPAGLAGAVTFAPLKAFNNKYYEPFLLEALLRRGKLAAALDDLRDRIPPPQPALGLLDPADVAPDPLGQYLVRQPRVTVLASLNPDLREAEIASARLFVNDREERLDAADLLGTGLARPLRLDGPGVYTVRLVARTTNPRQGAVTRELRVRYQRPRPVVKVLAPGPGRVKEGDVPFAAAVRAPGKVDVRLLLDDKDVPTEQAGTAPDLTVKATLPLKKGVHRLRLTVTNAGALPRFEEGERAEVEQEVAVDERVPAQVTGAELVYEFGNPDTKAVETRTVPLKEGDNGALDVPVRRFRVRAVAAGDGGLTEVTLVAPRGAKDRRLLPAGARRAEVKIDEEVVLDKVDEEQEWAVRAATEGTAPRGPRFKVRLRPPPPGLEVAGPEQTEYREGPDHKPPELTLRGTWTLSDVVSPFESRRLRPAAPAAPEPFAPFRVLLLVKGQLKKELRIDASPRTDEQLPLGPLALDAGENEVRVVLKNAWHEREVAHFTVHWRRAPVVRALAHTEPKRQGNRAETVLTAEVETPKGLPLQRLRIDNGGAALLEQPVDPARASRREVAAGIERWTVEVPAVPVQRGLNPLGLVAVNQAGASGRAEHPVRSPIDPTVALPDVVAPKVVTEARRQYVLGFDVHSTGAPLTHVWVRGARGDREEEVPLEGKGQSFGPAGARRWTYHLEHPVELTEQIRKITIRAENAGGGSPPAEVLASYRPGPPAVTIDERLPEGEAPLPVLQVRARVVWPKETDLEAVNAERKQVEKELRVYVNDFRQRRPRFEPDPENPREASFVVPLVLNQSRNQVKFECPGLHLVGAGPVQVACARPKKAMLHLLVVDVDGLVETGLADRVRAGLRLQPGQPPPGGVFQGWEHYDGTQDITPLTKEETNPQYIERVVQGLAKRIADSDSPSDMILIYWVGTDVKDERGRPALRWREGTRPLPVAGLLGAEGPGGLESVGARVVLLDVPAGAGGAEDPAVLWRNANHAAVIRYSWDRSRKRPGGLLEAMESVAQGEPITLDRIAQRAEQQAEKHPRPPAERVYHNLDVLSGLPGLLLSRP